MRTFNKNKGFTLIELLLVIVIIGLMLAVIVPRAWRANIDTKYGLVRMNCSELASFAQEWAEKSLLAQDETLSTATLATYMATLAGYEFSNFNPSWTRVIWIADTSTCNWNDSNTAYMAPSGRYMDGTPNVPPEDCVENIVPPDKIPRNPFNGVSVFEIPNLPTANPVTGAIACAGHGESAGGWGYFALLYQGTDSTTAAPGGGGAATAPQTSFHAGMSADKVAGLRNGIFMARVR